MVICPTTDVSHVGEIFFLGFKENKNSFLHKFYLVLLLMLQIVRTAKREDENSRCEMQQGREKQLLDIFAYKFTQWNKRGNYGLYKVR